MCIWCALYRAMPRPCSVMESVYQYVVGELSRGYLVEEDEAMFSEKQRRVLTFMKTPRELEKVCCHSM